MMQDFITDRTYQQFLNLVYKHKNDARHEGVAWFEITNTTKDKVSIRHRVTGNSGTSTVMEMYQAMCRGDVVVNNPSEMKRYFLC